MHVHVVMNKKILVMVQKITNLFTRAACFETMYKE